MPVFKEECWLLNRSPGAGPPRLLAVVSPRAHQLRQERARLQAALTRGRRTFVFAGSADPFARPVLRLRRRDRSACAARSSRAWWAPSPAPPTRHRCWRPPGTSARTAWATPSHLREGVKFQDGTTSTRTRSATTSTAGTTCRRRTDRRPRTTTPRSSVGSRPVTAPTGRLRLLHGRHATTATIKLKKPFAGFISALSLPAFAMQSPTALKKYQDDGADDPRTTDYSTAHPVGTGPFEFDSLGARQAVTLNANPDYWGEKPRSTRSSSSRSTTRTRADGAGERRDRRLRPGRRRPTSSRLEDDGYQIVNRDRRSTCSTSA